MAKPSNPLYKANVLAVRANAAHGRLIARLGTKEAPRGLVLSAYRRALRALRETLRGSGGQSAYAQMSAREILEALHRDVRAAVAEVMQDAMQVGRTLAEEQLRLYGITPLPQAANMQAAQAQVEAALSEVAAQIMTAQALLAARADVVLIVGDDTRLGALRPGPVVALAAQQAVDASAKAFLDVVQVTAGDRFRKQAVAALDERTTDCCLRVHGQVQDLDEPFHLTGTPRYADELQRPPFHRYCRTALCLYQAQYDDGLTARMRDAANQIQHERAAGEASERHPASAMG